MNPPARRSIWETVKAEKWWFLGPLIVLVLLLGALVLFGGGAAGQGFNYF